jgi:type II secretory pathway component PulC
MLGYYREMLDNPERVGRLYASFKPLRNETGGISGYHLGIEGEEDFLRDMGLREGDRVRAVNSLQMTSQSRAEYFIGEFVKGDLSAIVVDLERDGAPRKLVYLVR